VLKQKESQDERSLSWYRKNLDWKEFQEISLYLYNDIFQDRGAEEYLIHGLFQDGIDIISFKNTTGKKTCIQSKHQKKLGTTGLKEIIRLFMISAFLDTTDVFIITTSAFLQNIEARKYIGEQQTFFREEYGIQLEVWDGRRMEAELKKQFALVEHYFGPAEAKGFCFEPGFRKTEYLPVTGFMDRNLRDMSLPDDTNPYLFKEKNARKIDLKTLLSEKQKDRQRLAIIGEAYEGKSTLFRQVAHELPVMDLLAVPVLLDLKLTSIHPIDKLLEIEFNTWMSVPAKDLVVLIDGLDEVPSDQILKVTDLINEFGKEHPSIRIAFSCRRLYFSNFSLDSILPGFKFYELKELGYGQVLRHLEEHIPGKSATFFQEMDDKGISLLLSHPFYLTKLIKWYKTPGESIPDNKGDIAKKFITESLAVSSTRKMPQGMHLKHYKVRLERLLEQLALAFQIKGINSCEDEFIQEIFSMENISLLSHSPILDIAKNKWAFNTAFFQEQLAAIALLNYNAAEIEKLISVGNRIRKIKTNWIQTISAYLSLVNESSPDKIALIKVIEEDNIELIALSEGSKFNSGFKLEILNKIIERAIFHQTQLVMINESKLAAFIGNSGNEINYLLTILASEHSATVKIIIARILKYVRLNNIQATAYHLVAQTELLHLTDTYYGRLLLESLANYLAGDRALLDRLIKRSDMMQKHEFREGIYQFIFAHGLIDQYYDLLISGLDILYQYNSSITRMGSGKRVLKLMLETEHPLLIRRLLGEVSKPKFQSFFKSDFQKFLTDLQQILIRIYAYDKAIIIPIVDCVVSFGVRHSENDFTGIVDFFKATNSYKLALQFYLLNTEDRRTIYEFSDTITPDCYDYLIFACEENIITRQELDSFLNMQSYRGQYKELEQLKKLVQDAFGKPDQTVNRRHRQYAKADAYKEQNDLLYISSVKEFEQGLIKFFKKHRKNKITLKELLNREDNTGRYAEVNSYFLRNLIYEIPDNQITTLETCLEMVRNEIVFPVFRVKTLLNNYLSGKHADYFRQLLKSYYDETIFTFPFSEVNTESTDEKKILANQYLKIWAKHAFETPDDILLEFVRMDGEGLNFVRSSELNKRDSVGVKLMDHFRATGKEFQLKNKVLDNLKSDLQHPGVIGTHVEFCKHLKIATATPELLKIINKNVMPYGHGYEVIDVYLNLGGSLSDLVPLFESLTDIEEYNFMYLAQLLLGRHRDVVTPKLIAILNATETKKGKKLEAARYLAQAGEKSGYSYIIEQFDPKEEAPYDMQSHWTIWRVDTIWGLAQLEPLIFTLIDKTIPKFRFHSSIDYLILEILDGFASKGENDLQLVVDLLYTKAEEFKIVYPNNHGYLIWQAERMMEAFRKSNSEMMSNSEIKAFVQKILA
jgi:hypothetical protein